MKEFNSGYLLGVLFLILSPKDLVDRSHFNGCNGTFHSFVTQFTSRSVDGLLHRIVGKYTKYNRDVECDIQLSDAVADALTNKVKMLGFSLNHRSKRDDAIYIGCFCQ